MMWMAYLMGMCGVPCFGPQCKSKPAGIRLAWAANTSVAVVCMAPVIARAAIHWTYASLLVIATEPLAWAVPSLSTGMYHMSTGYINLGKATAWNGWCIDLGQTPVDGLASL